MIKEKIKKCLEDNILLWQVETNTLPKIKYDAYMSELTNMYVGKPDSEERIQWKYVPVNRILDFSDLEAEYDIQLPADLKDYYNSYFFLELNGFIDNECIMFNPIDETVDILDDLEYFLSGEEDEQYSTVDFIILGTYAHKYAFGFLKNGNGQVVALIDEYDAEEDEDKQEEYVLAESLEELFSKLKIENPHQGWYSVLTKTEKYGS